MASTVLPCFPNTTRGQPTALKICEVRGGPKGKQLIYALDRVVVIRAIEPEAGAGAMYTQLYTQHAYPVSAVAMAPSGCYVASGDVNGVVRVWACDNPEQILKLETPVFGGRIAAIDWSMDNTRIVAVGDGKSDKAKAFMWDSGNSVGDLGGHAAKINTVSYKPSRPFRVVTGADDKKVNFYSGPPFKFTCLATQHGNFVNAVAYSPNGERFLTASSDCTVELHDGKEGNKLVGEKARSRAVCHIGPIAPWALPPPSHPRSAICRCTRARCTRRAGRPTLQRSSRPRPTSRSRCAPSPLPRPALDRPATPHPFRASTCPLTTYTTYYHRSPRRCLTIYF